jgi:hypothetical protein
MPHQIQDSSQHRIMCNKFWQNKRTTTTDHLLANLINYCHYISKLIFVNNFHFIVMTGALIIKRIQNYSPCLNTLFQNTSNFHLKVFKTLVKTLVDHRRSSYMFRIACIHHQGVSFLVDPVTTIGRIEVVCSQDLAVVSLCVNSCFGIRWWCCVVLSKAPLYQWVPKQECTHDETTARSWLHKTSMYPIVITGPTKNDIRVYSLMMDTCYPKHVGGMTMVH